MLGDDKPVEDLLTSTSFAGHPKSSSDTWPSGVTTEADMEQFASTLFGKDKTVEDLLQGTPFAGHANCFLIRVKNACVGDFREFPALIQKAMAHAKMTIGNEDCIQVKSKQKSAFRQRIYDSMQVTPPLCSCRVAFGGDKHQRLETSATFHQSTTEMQRIFEENKSNCKGNDKDCQPNTTQNAAEMLSTFERIQSQMQRTWK